MWWYAPSAGTPTVERAIVVTPALRSHTWLPEPAFMTVSCRPFAPLLNSSTAFAVDERFTQPSSEKLSPTSSDAESGTRPVSLTPSNDAALFGSPVIAPGWPSVTPPRYVPLLAWPDESVMTVLGAVSPKRQ